MTVIGVTMVRDEADVIGATLANLFAQGVDRVIAADNLSSDGTLAILESFGDRVHVVADDEPGYYQDEKMSRLAGMAHKAGASWVLPFDADEMWHGAGGSTISEALSGCDADVVMAPGWDHIATAGGGLFSPWRRHDPQTLCKVAFRSHRLARLNMGNHDVRGAGDRRVGGPLEFRHFQYRTLGQMSRKLRTGRAAYLASDVHELHGTHWREGGLLDDEQMAEKWERLCSEPDLVFDPPPIFGRSLRVSVVIPAWNLHEMTAQAVASVEATAPGAEVVVVDNGSDPPIAGATVRNDTNEGFARACNQGAKAATGDLVVFLNNDTVCQPGWLDAMVARWCEGLAVGAHLTYPSGDTQHSGVFLRRRAGVLEAFNRTAPAASGEVPAVTGACLLMSRSEFDGLGGFDEGFRNAYEDVDLLLRHRAAGGRVWFESTAEVVHLESRTPGRFDHVSHNVALLNERWGHLPV